uniref:Uncharacterized protein n=1 Tax=Anguilla anguilla TaxID=7936 RepID=A0A0E9S6F4_ANGAN
MLIEGLIFNMIGPCSWGSPQCLFSH